MKPDKIKKEPYLFKVMNLHTGAGASVEETLWELLPQLSVCRQLELEWLEDFLSLFVDRMILMADSTLMSFLQYPGIDVPEKTCEEIIDSFLDKATAELEEINSIFLETLLLRLNREYNNWALKNPVPGVIDYAE